MASVQEHLNKMREERIAREKARIDKVDFQILMTFLDLLCLSRND